MSKNYTDCENHKFKQATVSWKVTICIYEIDKELISIIYKEFKQIKKKEVNEVLENVLE